MKDEGNWVRGLPLIQGEQKDHEQNGKKRKLADVEAMYGHCLIITLAWSLWEESQSETIKTVCRSWKSRCCRPARLLYYGTL